eukprot:TRINITY_DN53890_c0_g1_i1.p1 TRINITY_DN53890_c0_g1~~TRINITY_DN53890_c0_g1_i1.p1  ORF type:complete len:160 (-),score=6.15 TRINITY_DN53890_c0_g1_i1:31-462(-)
MFFYLFGGIFSSNFIMIFIICILALAADFWTVKNITGRLLVGLRYSNRVLEDGTNQWIFESSNKEVPKADSLMFWSTTYLSPVVWVVLGLIFSGFQLRWLILVAVAVILATTNLIGYWKCQRDASKKLQNYVMSNVITHAMRS